MLSVIEIKMILTTIYSLDEFNINVMIVIVCCECRDSLIGVNP